jgi:hypothetical protein
MREFIDIISYAYKTVGEQIAESFSLAATPLRDEDIEQAKLPSNVKEKLFHNRNLPNGTKVAVRLNLNGKVDNYFLQTVHNKSASGTALGYDGAVTVRNATFQISQRARELIATKKENKFPMAAVVGSIVQKPADLSGTEIRFNPMQSHLFEDLDGHAVRSAEEVTVFNTRCYARGRIVYWEESAAPKPLGNVPSTSKFKTNQLD